MHTVSRGQLQEDAAVYLQGVYPVYNGLSLVTFRQFIEQVQAGQSKEDQGHAIGIQRRQEGGHQLHTTLEVLDVKTPLKGWRCGCHVMMNVQPRAGIDTAVLEGYF
jgi:hypothetical protein